MQTEKFSFKVKEENGEGSTITLEKLVPRNGTDYKEWAKKFWNVMTLCGYPEKIAKKYLKLLTHDSFHEFIEPEDSINDQLRDVIKSKHNNSYLEVVLAKLERFSYALHRNIEAYYKDFEVLIKEANYCLEKE